MILNLKQASTHYRRVQRPVPLYFLVFPTWWFVLPVYLTTLHSPSWGHKLFQPEYSLTKMDIKTKRTSMGRMCAVTNARIQTRDTNALHRRREGALRGELLPLHTERGGELYIKKTKDSVFPSFFLTADLLIKTTKWSSCKYCLIILLGAGVTVRG